MLVALAFIACTADGKPDASDDTACAPATWYADADGDGYGTGLGVEACTALTDYSETLGDCDDGDSAIHPGAEEVCDGIDNDCDGVDDPPDQAWYLDQDGDGWGGEEIVACAQPSEGIEQGGDCDDGDPSVFPGAEETWYDGVDGNCDGADDYDADGDGYAVDVPAEEDCDDGDPTVYPGAPDVCDDGIDADCDGGEDPCAPLGVLDADDIDTVFLADGDLENLGYSVYIDDDSDGDGYPEVWMGAPLAEADDAPDNSGRLFRVEVRDREGLTASYAAEVTIDGAVEDGYLGAGTPVAGDFDGDGVRDFFTYDLRTLPGTDTPSGRGALFTGPLSGDLDWGDASLLVDSTAVHEVFYGGDDLAALANGEGRDRLVIASPFSEVTGCGRGLIYLLDLDGEGDIDLAAVEDRIASTDTRTDQFGEDLLVADLDGDGVDDIVTSNYNDSVLPGGNGKAVIVVYRGPFDGYRDMSDYDALRTNGPLPGGVGTDSLGKALALLPDFDGDGLPDLLVGAYGSEDAGEQTGAAFVYPGTITGELLRPEVQDHVLRIGGDDGIEAVGEEVTSLGDMDGDGLTDLAVSGRPDAGEGVDPSVALVYYGLSAGSYLPSDADLQVMGVDRRQYGGLAMTGGYDLDQDGFDDLVLGAWTYDDEALHGPAPPYPEDPTGYDGAVFVVFGGPDD